MAGRYLIGVILLGGLGRLFRIMCDRLPAMAELGLVAWPPAAIRTERLVLRESEARDRAAFIELFASPEVGTYIGGPRPRDELERSVPEDAVRIASPQLRRMVIGQLKMLAANAIWWSTPAACRC
jgi:hypothetical protein